ncbi:hypothetical protein [Candidatus Hydrogenosomobacter endosymbioticus]|uniref:Uncharacterized protein n=1 Tax=Candidatus Hydrogenosomobacter endosymbioticus TaxID=2558174 RepID=A0ABN6L224_9PROT|nr:hypothetical protein [Candidatus Hydrogenosomobacter endosymbioticus]BDB95893.1 hypothetical protein HYD_0260 [Candidatus Hydrogenosomobacter endosymbioticus]
MVKSKVKSKWNWWNFFRSLSSAKAVVLVTVAGVCFIVFAIFVLLYFVPPVQKVVEKEVPKSVFIKRNNNTEKYGDDTYKNRDVGEEIVKDRAS